MNGQQEWNFRIYAIALLKPNNYQPTKMYNTQLPTIVSVLKRRGGVKGGLEKLLKLLRFVNRSLPLVNSS